MNNKVSIIIPTYKRHRDIVERAVNSALAQTYENIEIVLVDDNARVDIADFRKEIAEMCKSINSNKIKYIVNETNKGSAGSRNEGIKHASGDYITFLDDDDVYLPEKVKNQLTAMLDSGADYSITDLDLYYTDETLAERRTRSYIKKTDPESLLKYHLLYVMAGTDTMMFKKEYLNRIGGFGGQDFGDDFLLFQKAIEANGKFCYANTSDIKAYVHKDEKGISIGKTKIDGENSIYNYKKRYFHLLNAKERRYVKMRHHAVLAYAYKRQRSFFKFIGHGVLSILTSPAASFKLLINLKNKK